MVRIDGKAGVQATIAFGQNEAIENVAVGDSQKWQITPNKRADLLFVKPLDSIARTNMTVVTNKRTYFFDLVASAKAKPLYMLRFTYKDDPKAAPATAPPLLPGSPRLIRVNGRWSKAMWPVRPPIPLP
ncbi:TrbG/VirB9 family P-type conjugative transfer protein [Novosphingobium colocasiae]